MTTYMTISTSIGIIPAYGYMENKIKE